ncbi:MAG: terpene cyclase/mutase family protein [Planctomycetaceae bacterium]|nr:terpene cyclase/mutase family protein [Planctomycetaceae bacterium]
MNENGSVLPEGADLRLPDMVIARAAEALIALQNHDGHWVGELEGDTILSSEYILLHYFLGWHERDADEMERCLAFLRRQQNEEGGFSLYPGGPSDISASVKAYFVLKLFGDDPQAPHMVKARGKIQRLGGIDACNTFTKIYLALFGQVSWSECPAVPPELILFPRWFPFNIYEMSSWSRTIVIPLSIIWAHKPRCEVPAHASLDDIRVPLDSAPEYRALEVDGSSRTWQLIFTSLDKAAKLADGLNGRFRVRPFRKLALKKAIEWMTERFENSDGLGAIFPPIIWSVVALRCLGYSEDDPLVQKQIDELEALVISDGESDRLQPCKSPVWDTAIGLLALRDADVPAAAPEIRRATEWLLAKECRRRGDWSDKSPHIEPSGWYFEFNNVFYPDVDDTAMVVMALAESLGGEDATKYTATLLESSAAGRGSAAPQLRSAIVAGRKRVTDDDPDSATSDALAELSSMRPTLEAIRRGVNWMLAMQCRNGGWGAFDADNTRELFTRVPFADHNAMIDPPTADITARVLEMFGRIGVTSHPQLERALQYVWSEQEPDHPWYGRWGVNYLYGTWQCLVGLRAIGIAPYDVRMQRASDWLEAHQQEDGGWGETARSYDDPSLRGTGVTTASQTSWALMGLMAAGRTNSDAVRRGVDYLIRTQNEDGTWDETEFTGTGFPKVFYLRYHMYRISFPLMALGRYRRLSRR